MPPRNFTDSEEKQIAKIYLVGHSTRAIARAYGKNHHISIVAALKRQGIQQRSKSERNRLYKLNPRAFDKIDNELAAYFLGYIFADGHVAREKTLMLACKWSDREMLEGVKEFLESEAPIKSIYVKDGSCSEKKHHQATFATTERHLAKRLLGLGIVKGRPDHWPMIDSTPPKLYNHLLRGFFDGDGSVHKINTTRGGALGFCGSCEFMVWICNLMAEKVDTNPNLKISKHSISDLYYLRYSGTGQALKVVNYLYRNATFWLARKKAVIESWPPLKGRNTKRNKKGQFAKTDPC